MAEMQELKRSAVKPEPHNVISSLQNNQGYFHGSLPNLDSVHMIYKDHLRDCTYSPGIQKQLVIPDTTSLLTPSLRRYSGGGIIRQRSVERRELYSSAPYSYSRSRSPSPNTNTAQVKAQPVILSHRERFDPLSTNSNRLQLPTNTAGRQRSHSDSRLSDLQPVNILPLSSPQQVITPLPPGTQFLPGSAPNHQLPGLRKSVIINSPATQRRNTEADIFHTESPKNPIRKVSEPSIGPNIIITFHDSDSAEKQQHPVRPPSSPSLPGGNNQNLYESYRARSPSHTGSPDSESGYSNHSSPGSPGVMEEQRFLDSELEDKLSEFRLNNPSEYDTLEKHLFSETNTLSFNNTQNSTESVLLNDIDILLAENLTGSVETAPEIAAEYDGDEILKRLEN